MLVSILERFACARWSSFGVVESRTACWAGARWVWRYWVRVSRWSMVSWQEV